MMLGLANSIAPALRVGNVSSPLAAYTTFHRTHSMQHLGARLILEIMHESDGHDLAERQYLQSV